MPRRYDGDKLVETVISFLAIDNVPRHYKEITLLLLKSGWRPPTKTPANMLFSRLRCEILRTKNAGPLRFIGNGVFCTESTKGVDFVEIVVRDNPKPRQRDTTLKQRSNESASEFELRQQRATEAPKCGNCSWITFPAAYIVSRKRGVCAHNQSEHTGVDATHDPCSLWKLRTDAQRRQDSAKQGEARAHVQINNAGWQKSKGR